MLGGSPGNVRGVLSGEREHVWNGGFLYVNITSNKYYFYKNN